MSPADTSSIEQAAGLLVRAQHAVALTGAGVSTRSGIPDFRSPGSGLWQNSDPFEVASLAAFQRRPEAFFEWIRPFARQLAAASPNPAHTALAELETSGILQAIVTQNIDGLHQKAGSQTVLELHGHMREATCMRCYRVYESQEYMDAFLADGGVPRCPACRNVLKPDIILFGEQLPAQVILEAQRHTRHCDVMLVAGSSLEVAPAADLPRLALRHQAQLILVNLQPTYIDPQATLVIPGDVAEVLPQIVEACKASEHAYDRKLD